MSWFSEHIQEPGSFRHPYVLPVLVSRLPAAMSFRGHLRLLFLSLLLAAAGPGGEPASAQPADHALFLSDSAYVDLGDPGDAFDLVPGGARTFALWIRYLQPQFHAKILVKLGEARQGGFSTFVHQYSETFGLWLGGESPLPWKGTAGLHAIGGGTWHHVALVQQDTLLLAYVDGEADWTLDVAEKIDAFATDQPLWLGWDGDDIIHFVGEVDELSIWHRALSARQIRRLMYDRPQPGDPGLVAYWSFDGSDPHRVVDESGNGHDGRLYGPTQRRPATRPTGPPLTKTWWFVVLCGLSGLVVLYGLMRFYARRIERQRRRLEGLVTERTEEVERQKAQLERQANTLHELDRAKSRFFANVSHEFRTPLTLTLGPLSDVRAGLHGPITPDTRRQIDLAILNNRRLLQLVNQLLDVARLEANELRPHLQRLDLAAYLQNIVQAFMPLSERKHIDFVYTVSDASLAVDADPDHLEKIVGNLLSNAFKFTPEGGRIDVSLRGDAEAVRLQVRDDGPGIAPDHLSRIFDRFYQADTGTLRSQAGTGIGLALAKELAELHGGRIEVESTEGFGTAFTVYLPPAAPAAVALAAAAPAPLPATPADRAPQGDARTATEMETAPDDAAEPDAPEDRTTVLVVDDNAEIRAFVRRHLGVDYAVVEAADGAEGLALAKALTPDLVVSDVMMPGMDGFELCRAMKTDPELGFIPVVLLTARAEAHDRLAGLDGGADDYLTKPFDTDELKARIRNLIALRQRLRETLGAAPPSRLLRTTVLSGAGTPDAGTPDAVFLDRLDAVVAERFMDEAFNVEALAEALGMDRSHLYRRIKDVADVTPSAYLWSVRLEQAAALLSARAGTVSEIAYGVGFKSVPHFTHRFQARYGCSPTAYAARHPGGTA